jgi:hypothetical protein
MDILCLKPIEVGTTITDSLYHNFFVNSLPQQYNSLVTAVDFEVDIVEGVVGKLCQIEIKKSLHMVDHGAACSLQKSPKGQGPCMVHEAQVKLQDKEQKSLQQMF